MSDATLPRIAGRYRLLHRVARTGSGAVYAAEDERSGQSVAVRCLERGADVPAKVAAFRGASLAAARFAHPYLARVLDEGQDRDGPFVVSEWVEGVPLEDWVGRAPPWGFVRAVCTQLCDVLAYLHAHSWVHLDVRPRGVAVQRGPDGPVIKLLSPGAQRVEHGLQDAAPGAKLTVKARGSVRYLAPEVADAPAWALGPATDLYGLGLVLWALLTGSVPYGEREGVALMLARRGEPAPHLPGGVGGAHHGALAALLLRLLDPEPARRPRAAAEVSAALMALEGPAEWADPRPAPRGTRVPFTPARLPTSGFPLVPHAPTHLVARDAPIDALWQALLATTRGYGSRLIVLEGPAAVAKSATVRFVSEHAAVRGLAQTWAVHFEAGHAPGTGLHLALSGLLRAGHTDRTGLRARVRTVLPLLGAEDAPAALALPSLLRPDDAPFAGPAQVAAPRFLHDAEAPGPGPGRAARLASVYLRLVRAAARHAPLLLWLDAVEGGADEETLGLVEAILAEPDLPVCVAATVRRGTPAAEIWQTRLGPEADTVRWCALEPLAGEGLRALLSARLDLAPAALAPVAAAIERHPETLEILTSALLESQLVSSAEGATLAPGALLAEGPDELRRAVFRQLPAEGPDVLVPDVVAGLAFARVPLTAEVVAALEADDPHRPYARALLAAERGRWVVRSAAGHCRFASPEHADWLRRHQSARAESWHRRWLRALARLEGGARGRYGVERAGHATLLGDAPAALQALLEAATWCLGPAEPDLGRGLEAVGEALRLATSLGDRPQAARAARLRAELWRHAGEGERARQSVQAAEAHLGGLGDTVEAGWCALTAGWVAYDAGMYEVAERRFRSAGEVFAHHGDDAIHWVTVGLGHSALARGDTAGARNAGREAELAFDALKAVRGGLAARLLRAQAADVAAEDVLAEARYQALQTLAEAHHWIGEAQDLRIRRAMVALRAGRVHDAAALIETAEAWARALDHRPVLDLVAALRPALAAALGDGEAARLALDAARLPPPGLRALAAEASAHALRHPTAGLDQPRLAALRRWLGRLRE